MWKKEKTITKEWNGHTFVFKIRSITYGEKTRIISDSTTTKVVNGKDDLTVNQMKLQMSLLLKTVESIMVDEKEYPKTIQTIEDLPPEVGDFLFSEVQEFSGIFRTEETKTD